MDFVYKQAKKTSPLVRQKYISDLESLYLEPGVLYVEKLDHLDYLHDEMDAKRWFFGDIILLDHKYPDKSKGFFYALTHDPRQNLTEFRSDQHSFLPIYYCDAGDEIIVSSSAHKIAGMLGAKTENSPFLTQMALFNVPLADNCFFTEIKRLPYGCCLRVINGTLKIEQETRVYDDFLRSPKTFQSALNDTVDIFISNCRQYIDQPSSIALTGGFDSRTILAVAHTFRSDFDTFTHGKANNNDVKNPKMLASELGFDHLLIDLSDQAYVEGKFVGLARQYLRYTAGYNAFLYPHLLYDADLLSCGSQVMLTGFCGSELLRNAHFGGAITSQPVIDLLFKGKEYAQNAVKNNCDYQILGEEYFNDELLQSSFGKLSGYFNELPDHLSKNQKLAVFEFEEVLPKLFGSFMYSSMHYIRTRLPFMDSEFYKTLLNSEISQVYRKFMEKNPVKRFWGQYLYAKIMERCWPELARLTSSKGYAPADLLSLRGKYRIIKGFMGKKKRLERVDYDNLSIISGISNHLERSEGLINMPLTARELSSLLTNQKKRDLACLLLSSDEYIRMTNH